MGLQLKLTSDNSLWLSSSDDEVERRRREREKEEYLARERAADEERRQKAGLKEPELKQYKANDDVVIEESGSTHGPRDKVDLVDTKEEIREKFSEVRGRLEQAGSKVKESYSHTKEKFEELKKKRAERAQLERQKKIEEYKSKAEVARAQEQYLRVKNKIDKLNAQKRERLSDALGANKVFASNESDFFGINMSAMSPWQWFGMGDSQQQSGSGTGMGSGFNLDAWREMTSYSGGSGKKGHPVAGGGNFDMDAYDKIFNSGWMGSGKKSNWDGNIMNVGGSSRNRSKGPSMDDVRKFYWM